jgi:3-hydroxyisobutyrate dehydrogenase-like beta-hydroxyacid dehydrogenase
VNGQRDTARGTAAVVGLGVMGAGIAHRLVECGASVRVWNRSPASVAPLVDAGAVGAPSPAAAAEDADVVFVCTADPDSTARVVTGEDGILAAGPIPGVLACAATVGPGDVDDFHARTPAVLDLGLLGNGRHAREGQLRIYVGGTRECLDRARGHLDLLARQVLHVGGPGDGMRLKLLMNFLMGAQLQMMAEAVELGRAAGLSLDTILGAITESGFSTPVMGFKARRFAADTYDRPDFRLRLMAKDLALVAAEAERHGLYLPIVEAARDTHVAAVEDGDGDLDCAAILRTVAALRQEVTGA